MMINIQRALEQSQQFTSLVNKYPNIDPKAFVRFNGQNRPFIPNFFSDTTGKIEVAGFVLHDETPIFKEDKLWYLRNPNAYNQITFKGYNKHMDHFEFHGTLPNILNPYCFSSVGTINEYCSLEKPKSVKTKILGLGYTEIINTPTLEKTEVNTEFMRDLKGNEHYLGSHEDMLKLRDMFRDINSLVIEHIIKGDTVKLVVTDSTKSSGHSDLIVIKPED